MPPPPKAFQCHGSGRPFDYRPGADLFEDADAEQIYVKRLMNADRALQDAGFTRVKGSNCWEKDGIATTSDHAAAEGIQAVLERHAEAVAVNFPERAPAGDTGTIPESPQPGPTVPPET